MFGSLLVAQLALFASMLGWPEIPVGDDGVPLAEACFPKSGLTELSSCKAMVKITESCKVLGSVEEKLKCACIQELLDSYRACKYELDKCINMAVFDSWFDQNMNDWHQLCDPRTRVTEPPPTNLCMQSWLPESSVSFVSCACQKPIYSLFSECQYNGNVSCYLQPAHESNILGYRECSYFWTGSETLPPVDMTSFLSITDIGMMIRATDAAEALKNAAAAGSPNILPPKTTLEKVVQTEAPELQEDL
ncbi:hypothetical protein QBC37DRAFT_389768 [Rhypophila decipiens]|uniref:Uncharacterized protein n=1 Tax=Rhypophila decipiens TaxID=261697 RepID=A0AAN6Y713_9PEZI|nr:hypothetical protein QBC37DRAFT_389768 [Rhypophila decipiens]